MPTSTNPESFEKIVQWAYGTLPQKIKDLPDFPGIQVVDEPPPGVLRDVAERRHWPEGTELLGLYSGVYRTERQHFQTRMAPDLIFVFRGPILRCSNGNLQAEVKRVVWHEVAHWLGHNEEEVRDLGLSASSSDDGTDHVLHSQARGRLKRQAPSDLINLQGEGEQLRCIKCYSADVTCHNVRKPFSYAEASPFDPAVVALPARICTCNSCGYEWDDEDNA